MFKGAAVHCVAANNVDETALDVQAEPAHRFDFPFVGAVSEAQVLDLQHALILAAAPALSS